MKFNIAIPLEVKNILDHLQNFGPTAYMVGDCVRDLLLDRRPDRFCILTSADFEEILADYKDFDRFTLDHGSETVAFTKNGTRYEIIYHKNSLNEYLEEQAFTINAMGYNHQTGLIDPLNGWEDIRRKRIKCIGSASESYKTDVLKIVEAIGYASQLDFTISPEDRKEIFDQCENLSLVFMENRGEKFLDKIRQEFCKIVCTHGFCIHLRAYQQVFSCLIPELRDMIDFPQNNPFHVYDVFEHTVHAIEQCKSDDLIVRLAVFFHDFGKPHSFQDGEDGFRHFKGHGRVSADITEKIMLRFGFDSELIKNVVQLVYYHDATFEVGRKYIRRWINKIGILQYRRLLELRKADIKGQNPKFECKRLDKVKTIELTLDQVIAEDPIFTRKDLAVGGDDLIAIGYKPGKEVGMELQRLLDCVVMDKVENKKDILLQLARQVSPFKGDEK